MPTQVTYPGVYIEEVSSGVRTITGVATSITAFLGRTLRGPVNEPRIVNNFGEFERSFGGLEPAYPLSYAVQDFFANGGSQAIIVRLYKNDAAGGGAPPKDRARIALDNVLTLEAATPGAWGNSLKASVDYDTKAKDDGSPDLTLYNLTVTDSTTGKTERIRNVTNVASAARYVSRVLANESSLVRTVDTVSDTRPAILQKLILSGGPTGGTVRLKLGTAETAAIQLADLIGANFEAVLKTALEGLASVGAGNISKVTRSGDSPNFSFLVSFGGTLAGPLSPIVLSNNSLTGGASPTVSISFSATEVLTDNRAADSQPLSAAEFNGSQADKTGLYALDKADLFNLLCIPPDTRGGDTPVAVYQKAMAYCRDRRAMLLVDSPAAWSANPDTAAATAVSGLTSLGLNGPAARNAALFFPRILQADPKRDGQIDTFVPCGVIAGIFARTDATRGVWKAPAGLDAALNGIVGLQVGLTDAENGQLNPLGINALRAFPAAGRVVWGARTLRGADSIGDEYKYIPVRRLALFIEETLYRSTQWVVFEPNDEPLWSQIRLNLGAFMQSLFRQGAFQGSSPREAYFVKCDKETTTQDDINQGIVNIVVGFAPLKPAEFVIIKIQQIAGEIVT